MWCSDTDVSNDRIASIKALKHHVEPIPDNPQDACIQNVFTKIRRKNANQVLAQSADSAWKDVEVLLLI